MATTTDTPSAPSQPNPIPPELITLILSYLSSDKISLSSCSLVSQQWLLFSRQLLFNKIIVVSPMINPQGLLLFISFVRHLQERNLDRDKSITTGIKFLEIAFRRPLTSREVPPSLPPICRHQIHSLLSGLPNLHTLKMNCVYITALCECHTDLTVQAETLSIDTVELRFVDGDWRRDKRNTSGDGKYESIPDIISFLSIFRSIHNLVLFETRFCDIYSPDEMEPTKLTALIEKTTNSNSTRQLNDGNDNAPRVPSVCFFHTRKWSPEIYDILCVSPDALQACRRIRYYPVHCLFLFGLSLSRIKPPIEHLELEFTDPYYQLPELDAAEVWSQYHQGLASCSSLASLKLELVVPGPFHRSIGIGELQNNFLYTNEIAIHTISHLPPKIEHIYFHLRYKYNNQPSIDALEEFYDWREFDRVLNGYGSLKVEAGGVVIHLEGRARGVESHVQALEAVDGDGRLSRMIARNFPLLGSRGVLHFRLTDASNP